MGGIRGLEDPGDEFSSQTGGNETATVCTAGGAIRELVLGTDNLDSGAGFTGETLQQVELWGCA